MVPPTPDQRSSQQRQPRSSQPTSQSRAYQGVLYKRRDFFARQWRPRWFVLRPTTRVLTYYLFSRDEPRAITVGSTPSTRNTSSRVPATAELGDSMQYDVVPRGTIYLPGCRVEANEEFSRPEEHVYAFIITAPAHGNSAPCCLATTTAEAREEWVQRLTRACNGDASISSTEANVGGEQATGSHELEDEGHGEQQETEGRTLTGQDDSWSDMDPDVATSGLSPDMICNIDSVLTRYLPYAEGDNKKEHNWSALFENRNGVTSYQRTEEGSESAMIKSVATMDHHPKQIFNLVADIKRRQEYEKNVRYDERLKRCNSHTFIDYYAYEPVWPTTSREFLVLFHWRVLKRENSNEKAIVMVGFSYPQGYDLRPVTNDNVRANLDISLFLLQLLPNNKTMATRILSYDLCGNIPRSLSNTIMQQQATMPHVISTYLKESEPMPPSRLSTGDISNEVLAVDVIERLPDEASGIDCVRRHLQFENSSYSSAGGDDNEASIESSRNEHDGDADDDVDTSVSTLLITLILSTPLIIYKLLGDYVLLTNDSNKEFLFLVSAFVAVRTVVLLKLGTPILQQPTTNTGAVSMRFSVNLKSVLQFLAKRREDDCEGRELSVVPIVVKAVGKALSEIDEMNCKKISFPYLGVSGCFLRNNIDISILGASEKERVVTINDILNQSAEQIAFKLDHYISPSRGYWRDFRSTIGESLGLTEGEPKGSCLVITSPDSDGHEIEIDIAPAGGFNAVVVVGGVRLAKHPWPKSIASPTPRVPPKPKLSMSISVDCPACSIADCRRFAERVHELVEHPDA